MGKFQDFHFTCKTGYAKYFGNPRMTVKKIIRKNSKEWSVEKRLENIQKWREKLKIKITKN